jgi:hypothetical protein
MTSELAKQLNRLKKNSNVVPITRTTLPSLLFDPVQAVTIDSETIFSIGQEVPSLALAFAFFFFFVFL